jgi:predicted RND superfamily exporter protein/lauroyl/myristoyl acyltransferase
MRALRKWWWIFLAVPVALGLARLHFDMDVLDLLPADQPGLRGLKLYQERFSNARELILTVRFPNGTTAEQLAGELAAQLRSETNLVAGVSWQPPWMEQPAQAAEIAAYIWFNQPPEAFGALTNRLAPDHVKAALTEAREALATSLSPLDIARRAVDPYDLLNVPALTEFSGLSADQAQQMFASADGTFRLLFIEARGDLATYRDCAAWLSALKRAVGQFTAGKPEWAGTICNYTGRPAFVAEIATGMQRDLTGSITGTAVIIALLFWLAHRRWRPMLWLLFLLGLILISTMGLGSLLLGTINVVSLGFAAVLLGLAVDYAVVHYQEALAHPQLTVPQIRRAIAPSILWAAITTTSAFLVLNLGGLPGLAQLGSLVAIGVALAAVVMVVAFLPPLFPERCRPSATPERQSWWTFLFPNPPEPQPISAKPPRFDNRPALWLSFAITALAVGLVVCKPPVLDTTGNALRLRHSEAEMALKDITAAVGLPQEPIWCIATGSTESEVYQRLICAEALLRPARSNGCVNGYLLPTALWPRADCQVANRAAARWLGVQREQLHEAALREGFYTNALFLTDELLLTWARFGSMQEVSWPTNQMSQWLLKRFAARSTNEFFALGLVYPGTNQAATASLAALSEDFQKVGISLSGWPLLGIATLKRVQQRLWLMVVPMVALVLFSLWLAFRTVAEVLLGLAVLLLGGLCLLAVMGLAGWSWNLLNLMAVPLILGTGVDYGIFIQLGLRRHGGDASLVRRSIGRALLLCGGTAIAGFGSLAWSSNLGMASLGKVCAMGIAANMLISIFLLPSWWLAVAMRPAPASASRPADASPSALYRAGLWRAALIITRVTPRWLLQRLALLLADAYHLLNHERREAVLRNLLPALEGDRLAAIRMTRRVYRQFALKLLDLWSYENGVLCPIQPVQEPVFEAIKAARARGQGVLILTPHLGNWELGAPLFKNRGIPMVAITQGEPGSGFTELRSARRAKWGIETLVIGQDAFAFVEVIRRLQEGAVIALLLDRPSPATAVNVELFGRPFPASIAAAELARASGCAIFCVTIVRSDDRYLARLLQEMAYDRRSLGTREARQKLTQELMSVFEPEIHDHLDQWFHFVPIWPEEQRDQPAPVAPSLVST